MQEEMGRALWAFILISKNAGTSFHTVRFSVHFHQLQNHQIIHDWQTQLGDNRQDVLQKPITRLTIPKPEDNVRSKREIFTEDAHDNPTMERGSKKNKVYQYQKPLASIFCPSSSLKW